VRQPLRFRRQRWIARSVAACQRVVGKATQAVRCLPKGSQLPTIPLPRAILFDLDDTLIGIEGRPDDVWLETLEPLAGRLGGVAPAEAAAAIMGAARAFWADVARHKEGRLNLVRTRREIAATGLAAVGIVDEALSHHLGDEFQVRRDARLGLFEGALETLDHFARRGVALALVTNGSAAVQRAKIDRFALWPHFRHVQIEGEVGFGKPEPEAYAHALATLGVAAADTWMVGDNLDWEVVAPQRLGIYTVWHDIAGKGLPEGSTVRPDRIVRRVVELIPSEDGMKD